MRYITMQRVHGNRALQILREVAFARELEDRHARSERTSRDIDITRWTSRRILFLINSSFDTLCPKYIVRAIKLEKV